eukprot:gnl/Hemi2/23640_TR7932_c0_g1_i1.p1 gnl/Hemi2/23640_TR7932_c0_g1~~gnl/Hemi2/23640_TR7932_c0_g1_i1.p1  ORF type:complete len:283 (-),score=104.64 gnl/Hemi2/23640_TR7932_c0_g1_i1:288-1136(-)
MENCMLEFCRLLGVSDKAKAKAEELLRLSYVKFPTLVKDEICRTVVCIDLACQTLREPLDDIKAANMSGSSKQKYRSAVDRMSTLLGKRVVVTAQELALQLGCVHIVHLVLKTEQNYKSRLVASMPASRQADVLFDPSLVLCVAFFLVAKKQKLAVDRKRLFQIAGLKVKESEFQEIKNSMEALCSDTVGKKSLATAESSSLLKNRHILDIIDEENNRKRKASESGASKDDAPEALVEPAPKRARLSGAYEAWKGLVLAAATPLQSFLDRRWPPLHTTRSPA